jgi:predicted metal-dependent peptidase
MISDETRLEAQHKLAAGRILASRKMPYFTTALMAISPFEREGLGTFAVDKRWRMYYDPQKCIEYTVPEICAVWLHEVGHLIRSHSKRFAELEGFNHDPRLFNCAGDAAINSDLRDSEIILPDPERRYYAESNPEFPEWKKGMTAEEMYFIGWRKQGNLPPDESPSGTDESADKEEGDNGPETETDTSNNTAEETDESEGDESEGDESEADDSETDDSKADDSDKDSTESPEQPDSGSSENEDDAESSDDELGTDSDTNGESENESSDADSDDEVNDSGSDGDDENQDGSGGESAEDADEESENSSDSGAGDTSESSKNTDESSNDDDHSTVEPKNSDKMPDCGSAVDGEPRDYEEKDTDDGSVDESTEEFLKRKTAESIMDFEKSNPGSVPGGLLREAKTILDPQVDWQSEFAALIRHVSALHAGYADYSYQRPSRRSSGSAFIMPSMRQPPAPEITIILDTSGSMDESKELAMALGEMEEIVNRSARFSVSQSVRIINCDAADNVAVVVRDLKDFEIIGGGGTDMRVGIKAAAEMKPAADIIITITDGYTPWPAEIPYQNAKATYIALIVSRGKRKANPPPEWMKVIEVIIPEKRHWSGPKNM